MKKNTLSRIKEFIDFIGVNNSLFEKEIGMSNGSFSSQLKNNKTIGVDKLENILKKYPDINPEWLLTGHGSMLKKLEPDRPLHALVESPPDELNELLRFKVATLEQKIKDQHTEIEQLKKELSTTTSGKSIVTV